MGEAVFVLDELLAFVAVEIHIEHLFKQHWSTAIASAQLSP